MKLLESLQPGKDNVSKPKELLNKQKKSNESTEKERDKFKELLIKNIDDVPYLDDDNFDSSVAFGLMTTTKYDYYKKDDVIKKNVKNPPYEEELISFKNYTGGGYRTYNQYLRDSMSNITKESVKDYKENIESSIKMAESALEYMPKFEGIAKRAAILNSKTYDYYKKNLGKVITEKGFTSSTSSKALSTSELLNTYGVPTESTDKPTVFLIKSKNGKEVQSISDFPEE